MDDFSYISGTWGFMFEPSLFDFGRETTVVCGQPVGDTLTTFYVRTSVAISATVTNLIRSPFTYEQERNDELFRTWKIALVPRIIGNTIAGVAPVLGPGVTNHDAILCSKPPLLN